MLVSVIIPTYNRALTLRQALLSVVRQTFHDREIIIIDDGSTDDSYSQVSDIVRKYNFIHYERTENNLGVSSARNRGVLLSKGKYTAFLDSDDIWRKKKLEIQMNHILGSPYKICYTNERWIRNGLFVNQNKSHRKYTGDIFPSALKICMVSPSSVLFERSVFDRIGLFDEELPVAEDYDLFIRASIFYRFLFINNPLVIKYGGHSDQLSRSEKIMDAWRIKALENIYITHCHDLSYERKLLMRSEIMKKSLIISKGALKRMNRNAGLGYLIKAVKYGL